MGKHIVFGAGEVGRAIAAVLSDNYEVHVADLGDDFPTEDIEAIHICFPFTTGFGLHVRNYRNLTSAPLVIIHSTVPVGTSTKLSAVHSPVTGKHPNLELSVRTFTKFFGGPRAGEAAQFFSNCGLNVHLTDKAETTELGKLWQTTQYGILIAMQKEIYKDAREIGADPKVAYDQMNFEYSEGYYEMGMDFQLPILKDMPGEIGGHCVIQNLPLLGGPLAEVLEELNEDYKHDSSTGPADPEQT